MHQAHNQYPCDTVRNKTPPLRIRRSVLLRHSFRSVSIHDHIAHLHKNLSHIARWSDNALQLEQGQLFDNVIHSPKKHRLYPPNTAVQAHIHEGIDALRSGQIDSP